MSKTFSDMMKECFAIKTQEEADKWFKAEVDIMHEANPSWPMSKCASAVRSNLGYMAGYYDKAASEHVHKFFNADHPIFGGPGYWDTVTPSIYRCSFYCVASYRGHRRILHHWI